MLEWPCASVLFDCFLTKSCDAWSAVGRVVEKRRWIVWGNKFLLVLWHSFMHTLVCERGSCIPSAWRWATGLGSYALKNTNSSNCRQFNWLGGRHHQVLLQQSSPHMMRHRNGTLSLSVCVCVCVCACVVFSWNIYLCFPPGHFFLLFFPLNFNVCIYDCGCMWCALILVRCV